MITRTVEDYLKLPYHVEIIRDEDYSGKFVMRLPKSLHRQLAEVAEREGVSLNQFINTALAQAVGSASVPVAYRLNDKTPALAVREGKK